MKMAHCRRGAILRLAWTAWTLSSTTWAWIPTKSNTRTGRRFSRIPTSMASSGALVTPTSNTTSATGSAAVSPPRPVSSLPKRRRSALRQDSAAILSSRTGTDKSKRRTKKTDKASLASRPVDVPMPQQQQSTPTDHLQNLQRHPVLALNETINLYHIYHSVCGIGKMP
jgi:hypothetical protein